MFSDLKFEASLELWVYVYAINIKSYVDRDVLIHDKSTDTRQRTFTIWE